MLPRIQIQTYRVVFAIRSSQEENRSLGAEQFGPDNFAMQQNSNLSVFLEKKMKGIQGDAFNSF